MRQIGRWLIALVLLGAVAALIAPGTARARSVEWATYDVTLTLNEDSSFRVVERQEVEFTGGPFSFAFAEIPTTRMDDIRNITVSEVRDGQTIPYAEVGATRNDEEAETFVVEPERNAVRITWYMPRTVDETRTFLLEYDVVGGLRVYVDEQGQPRQQIWWIAIPEGATEVAPIRNGTFTVQLPRPVDLSTVIIEGPGDDDPSAHSDDGQTFRWEAGRLTSGEDLEARIEFPAVVQAVPPAWQEADDARRIREEEVEGRRALINLLMAAGGLLALTAGGVGLYGLWYTRGRDPHVGAVAAYLATPPNDLAPGAAGALVDEEVQERDIVATLVDLGNRGVLRIKEVESGGLGGLFASKDFEITRTENTTQLRPFEATLVRALLGDASPGTSSRLSQVKQRFTANADTIRDQLYDEIVRRGYFAVSPEKTRSRWRGFGFVTIVAAVIGGGMMIGWLADLTDLAIIPFLAIGLLGFAVLMVAGAMPRKTASGAEDAAKWRAFKKYLDDIEQYENVDEAKEIFERYLPYAVAFGIERGWVQKFATVGTQAPQWYGGGGWVGWDATDGFPRRRGPYVSTGGGWGGGFYGGDRPSSGGGDSSGGGFDVPDLQQTSDRGLGSLQNLSGGLFDLLDVAGSAFEAFSGSGGGRHGGFSGGGRGGGGGGGGSRGFG